MAAVDGTSVGVGDDGAVEGKLRLSGVGCIRAAGGEVNIDGWAVGQIAFFSQVRIEEVEGRQGGGPVDGEEGGGRVRRGSVRETVLCVCGARGGGGMGGRCCGCSLVGKCSVGWECWLCWCSSSCSGCVSMCRVSG